MRTAWKYLIVMLFFLALAGLIRFWIAPLSERLAADYSNSTDWEEEVSFRDSPNAEWQKSMIKTKCTDQTITNFGQVAIIEGGVHSYYPSGEVNFESISLYGVDRRTRQNVSGYGEVNRSGQYLFPTHVQQIAYPIWDPLYIGLRQATFEHTDTIGGLQVYVFSISGFAMDETSGYSYLVIVPAKYSVHTIAAGTLWVEPLSGIVVDYLDNGLSYFVDRASGERIADFNQWSERYTPETQTAQLARARSARLRILALEIWLPGALALMGLMISGIMLFKEKKKAPSLADAETHSLENQA